MGLSFLNLDETTRQFMLQEMQLDQETTKLYISSRLSDIGKQRYPQLLKTALEHSNDDWLAEQIQPLLNSHETRGERLVKVANNAHITLAEGEFNRFYVRGLCRRAIEAQVSEVTVYRAKYVENPRSESEAKIGSRVDPKRLLDDVRNSPGIETALGVPPGPNSGLSVKLP